jgi:hypothetical protein
MTTMTLALTGAGRSTSNRRADQSATPDRAAYDQDAGPAVAMPLARL